LIDLLKSNNSKEIIKELSKNLLKEGLFIEAIVVFKLFWNKMKMKLVRNLKKFSKNYYRTLKSYSILKQTKDLSKLKNARLLVN